MKDECLYLVVYFADVECNPTGLGLLFSSPAALKGYLQRYQEPTAPTIFRVRQYGRG